MIIVLTAYSTARDLALKADEALFLLRKLPDVVCLDCSLCCA